MQDLVDHCFNYAQNFVVMGLIERYFRDAIKEVDGPRLFRKEKMKMFYFKEAGRHKRTREAMLPGTSVQEKLYMLPG